MSTTVGNFSSTPPWMTPVKMSIARAPMNEHDKTTIISIFPQEIVAVKPTIFPGKFVIPAGSFEVPSITVVGQSSWFYEFAQERIQEMPTGSVLVANSIIDDYCNGLPGVNLSDAKPGLFFEFGVHTLADVKTKFLPKLAAAKAKQEQWFKNIVQMADVDWARSNRNPLVIWDMAKIAATALNMNTKEWLKDNQILSMVPCTACGTLRNPEYPVCPNCKMVVDADAAKKLGLKFAQ